MALLRTVQPDVRKPLVREALDILTPALPARFASGTMLMLSFLAFRARFRMFCQLLTGSCSPFLTAGSACRSRNGHAHMPQGLAFELAAQCHSKSDGAARPGSQEHRWRLDI